MSFCPQVISHPLFPLKFRPCRFPKDLLIASDNSSALNQRDSQRDFCCTDSPGCETPAYSRLHRARMAEASGRAATRGSASPTGLPVLIQRLLFCLGLHWNKTELPKEKGAVIGVTPWSPSELTLNSRMSPWKRDGSQPVAPRNVPSTEPVAKAADAGRQEVEGNNSKLWEVDSCEKKNQTNPIFSERTCF